MSVVLSTLRTDPGRGPMQALEVHLGALLQGILGSRQLITAVAWPLGPVDSSPLGRDEV